MAATRDRPALEYGGAAAIVAAVTLLCLVLRDRLASIDVAMLLLMAVVAASARFRRGAALLASVLSILAFDFLFVPPYYRLSVHDTDYYLTFLVMLVVAVIMSGLTARIREEADAAGEREARTAALLAMEGELASAANSSALVAVAARHLERATRSRSHVLLPGGEPPALPALAAEGFFETAASRVAATWAWESGEPAGWSMPHGREAEILVAPLRGAGTTVGLIALKPEDPDRELGDADRETVIAMARLAGQALERQRLAERSERARVEVEAERLRTALLSSLSHDLRTPLAGIEGAASSLLDGATPMPADVERELLEGIVSETRRMTRLVTNLLDMIRVDTGALALERSWQPLEEPLGVALMRMEDRLRGHPVTTRLPSDLPLVPVDELLLEQVFLNLFENAARYTPPGTAIDVSAAETGGHVLVEVADRGPGIPAEERERVFERFYRGGQDGQDGGAGSGLGLTICRGIVTAHGGRIWAEPREGGGTCMRFTLPLEGTPPAALPAEPGESER